MCEIENLLLLCTKNAYFSYNNEFCTKDVVGKGSLLGPVLAGIFMVELESKLVPSASFCYKRKVKKRHWNTSNTRLKLAQIAGIIFRINCRVRGWRV